MTVNRGLWVPITTGDVGTTEREARLADVGLFESNNGADARSGVLLTGPSALVTGAAGGMTYNIGPATYVITRAAGEGVYRFTSTGVSAVTTLAAPVSGSRIDVIWVKQNDQSKGDADNQAIAGVTRGAPDTIPVPPAIPEGALELAQATVSAGVTQAIDVSIVQTFRHAALRGNPIPVRNDAERAEITAPRLDQEVRRLDLPGAPGDVWTGTEWASTPRPAGVLSRLMITTSSNTIVDGIIQNVGSFAFRGGRKYRIVWDAEFSISTASNYFEMSINLASPTDAAVALTGLTKLDRATVTGNNTNSAEHFRVEAFYEPTADIVRQVKWRTARVVGGGTVSILSAAGGPGKYYIEDLGRNY